MSPEQAAAKMRRLMDKSLPQIAEDLIEFFGQQIEMAQGDLVELPDHFTAEKGVLTSHSRRLEDSFRTEKNSPDTVVEIKRIAGGVNALIGSSVEYARIQNDGGDIQSTEKMTAFFWAMYYETDEEDDFWKYMALHAAQGLPIHINETEYFDEAVERFEKRAPDEIQREFSEIIRSYAF